MTYTNSPEDSSFYLVGSLACQKDYQSKFLTFKWSKQSTIKATVKMGPYFLNFYCKKLIDNPYFTVCNLKDKPEWEEIANNRIVIDSKSMEFHFYVNRSTNTIMLEKIKVKIFLG